MSGRPWWQRAALMSVSVAVVGSSSCTSPHPSGAPHAVATTTSAGPTATVSPAGIYAGQTADKLDPSLRDLPVRVYVPNGVSDTVSVIDQGTMQVISTLRVGREPQHIVPSYDLKTLWVLNNQGNTVIPIDAAAGHTGAAIPVDDPYNLYFTPDGMRAVVVAERHRRLDFRDPHTMALTDSLSVPECAGINHMDYAGDGSYALVTCEFAGKLAKIDIVGRKVLGVADLGGSAAMPQDVRVAPDGTTFYVADMKKGGVHVFDSIDTFDAFHPQYNNLQI